MNNRSPVNALSPEKGWITTILEQLEGKVTAIGPDQWRLKPRRDRGYTRIVIDAGWLVVERALPGRRMASRSRSATGLWQLLERSPAPPSGARVVLSPGENELRIRAERAIVTTSREDSDSLARWLGAACADTAATTGQTHVSIRRGVDTDVELSDGAHGTDLPALCELSGWRATVRGGSDDTPGETTIGIPARDGGFVSASVTTEPRSIRISVDLDGFEGEPSSPTCQTAVALALLRLAGSVRAVRPTASCTDGHLAVGLEITVYPPVHAEVLDLSLSALAFAFQQIATELPLLATDDALADAYLSLQGVDRGRGSKEFQGRSHRPGWLDAPSHTASVEE